MMSNTTKNFAVLGCGFWAQYQIAAWQELPHASLLAVCDPDADKSAKTARRFGAKHHYTDAVQLFASEQLDFVDIISSVETHAPLVKQAADHQVPVICQKPLAPDINTAREMVAYCQQKDVPLFVHENFRFQAPIRRVKAILDEGQIGQVFRGRLSFNSAFPVFENQPFLAKQERFIIADIGSHILDMARFLLGEVNNLRCLTRRVNPVIKGEDVATVLMEMRSGAHCSVEMSYASLMEKESFPQTLILLEGETGSIRLDHDHLLTLTNWQGVHQEQISLRKYDWVDENYALVQSCMTDINRDFLQAIQGEREAEITGTDNLKTMELVYAAYESAEKGKLITINQADHQPALSNKK